LKNLFTILTALADEIPTGLFKTSQPG